MLTRDTVAGLAVLLAGHEGTAPALILYGPLADEMGLKITLCATCALGRGTFPERLRHALAREKLPATVSLTDCMSGCTRPSTLAVRDAGKTAYLFGDLDRSGSWRTCYLFRDSTPRHPTALSRMLVRSAGCG